MKEHYVIVHESCINSDSRYPEARLVFEEIDAIKKNTSWSESPNDSSKVSGELPKPNDDLKILVCGAYSGAHRGDFSWCVDLQLKALIDAGYNARLHELAVLKVDFDRPKQRVGYPEFLRSLPWEKRSLNKFLDLNCI
jgi:hypothetical protein